MEEKPLLLTVLTPDGEQKSVRCDSVRFSVPDSRDGRIRGGSVGIRRGHVDALMTVAPGKIEGFCDGTVVLVYHTEGGIAVVSENQISVLVNRREEGRSG